MIARLCLIALCLCAGPLHADCITAADLDQGIRATLADDGVEEYRAIGENLIELRNDYGDGVVTNILLAHGVYVIDVFDTENGQPVAEGRTVTRYPVTIDAMPLPEAGGTWQVAVELADAGGISTEQQSHRWEKPTTVTYDGCTYEAIPGTIRYDYPDGWYIEELLYLPAIGIGLLTASEDNVEGRYVFAPYVSFAALGN